MPLLRILRNHPFTQGMPDSLVKKLAAMATHVEFDEDEIIFRAGEQSKHFCLLLCGSVSVEIRTPYYSMSVQTLGPGDAFGWSSLAEEHHTVFQVRAREASNALFLDGEKLTVACQSDPKLGAEVYRRLVQVMAKRVRAIETRLAEFCGSVNKGLAGDRPL